MATEMIGGAFFSTLFGKLFEKLASPEYVNFFGESKVNEELLRKLKIMLCSANQLLDDAEEKQLTKPAIREWLFELKEAVFVAEELLDDINYETLQYEQEIQSRCSISKRLKLSISSINTFDKAIEKIIDRLDFIVKQKLVFGLKESFKNRLSQRLPTPLVEESCVYGRGDDKKYIIELLLDNVNGDKMSVIPIVGMGGIGKTTLAQLIYDDPQVKNHFDLKAWVTVSDEFDIFKITKKIFLETNPPQCKVENNLDQLQRKLKKALSGKIFFIVLDDVWNERYDDWDVLKSPFQSGARGSKIIVTTRSNIIAERMRNVPSYYLQTVSDDNCWRLFVEHAFKNVSLDSHQDLHEIRRDIVKKCKGLPLAVKSLAGLLRSVSDQEEWKKILKSDIWELQSQQSNNILPSLWLSYQYLPSYLKPCFAYCSIFPKDHEFTKSEKEKIILLWMAEGLLRPGHKGKRMEDIGDEYFQDLISRSLFQWSNKEKSTLLMHDLVHDLAMFVSGEFSFGLDDNEKTKFSCKTRHFSYFRVDDMVEFDDLSKARSLRTCIQLSSYKEPSKSVSWPKQLLIGRCLRALCVSNCPRMILPDSIGNLKHLRYLDLSYSSTLEIPNSLCSLYNLQTLRLAKCRYLTRLPSKMGNLVNLRHLDIKGVPLEKMPRQMCNMKDLQTLSQFVLGGDDGSASIKELGNLNHLSGTLGISVLKNVVNVADVSEANLYDKKYLGKLSYSWNSYDASANFSASYVSNARVDSSFYNVAHDEVHKDLKVLDALRPHTNVKEVIIWAYRGTRFSRWVGQSSYISMVKVHLLHCKNCQVLPPLGQLPSLEFLEIDGCHGVVKVANEFYGNDFLTNKPFRSLKCLRFQNMSEWEEWSFVEGLEESGCFPCLEYLGICHCPKLNVRLLPDYFPSLKKLGIMCCEKLMVFFRTEEMENAFAFLQRMSIANCPRLESLLLTNLPSNLKSLLLHGSQNYYYPVLECSPLPRLQIIGCENVLRFPEMMLSATLTFLHIYNLPNLKVINGQGFINLTGLQQLRIENCEELQYFPEEWLPTSLTCLFIWCLPKLESLGGKCFQHFISLKELVIWDCEKLQCLLEEGLPTSLISLSIGSFPNLQDLSCMGFQHLMSLKEFEISYCEKLQCLPEEGLPLSLSHLRIKNCPLLVPRCQRETGEDWPHIAQIPFLDIW